MSLQGRVAVDTKRSHAQVDPPLQARALVAKKIEPAAFLDLSQQGLKTGFWAGFLGREVSRRYDARTVLGAPSV